uniref:Uncharacterized protein n=1 Tax=Arundo donax TaxID=35708 RepID=A0A0A9FUA5_ARUDO
MPPDAAADTLPTTPDAAPPTSSPPLPPPAAAEEIATALEAQGKATSHREQRSPGEASRPASGIAHRTTSPTATEARCTAGIGRASAPPPPSPRGPPRSAGDAAPPWA